MRKGRTQTGKIRDKIERVTSSTPFVRGYLHQDLVFSKTENQIGFSISASTQNQALSALLFLYQEVLKQEIG